MAEPNAREPGELLEQLGLDATIELPPRETITGETLTAAQTHRNAAEPSRLAPEQLGIATLPRLEVLLPGTLDAPPSSEADLVVRDVIGAGGMGAIYSADQRSLGREVALKTLRFRSPEAESALVVEGAITGKLEHPGIPSVHALGRATDGRPVIVMKRIVGVGWVDLLDDDDHPRWKALRMLPAARLDAHLRVLAQVAEAVQFAHDQGFVHRDVKPENVMVGEHGEVWLVDWGIATRLQAGARCDVLIGTPAYMAPEQVNGGALDARTDVYLLGAALHYALVRKPKHEGKSLQGVLVRAMRSEAYAYPRTVPVELAELANRATALDPAARPASAFAFREAIEAFFANRASSALSESASARLRDLESRIRAGVPDPVDALRIASEARFGFLEALREDPASQSARAGLDRCLRATIRLELSRESVASARLLLSELDGPPEELAEELERLERRLTKRRTEGERLRQLAHDADPLFAARMQGRFLLGLLAFVSVLGVVFTAFAAPTPFDAPVGTRYLVIGWTYVGFTVLLGAALRGRLDASQLSRRMYLGLVVVLLMFGAHRAFAVERGDALWVALETDNLILAAGTLGLGALTHPAWLAGGAVFSLGTLLIHLLPAHVRLVSGLATPVATALAAAVILRERREEAPPSAAR